MIGIIISVIFVFMCGFCLYLTRLHTLAISDAIRKERERMTVTTLPRPSITFSSKTHMGVETPMVPVGPCFHANYPYCWGIESQTVFTQEQLEELRKDWMMIFDELVGDDIQHFLTTKKDK